MNNLSKPMRWWMPLVFAALAALLLTGCAKPIVPMTARPDTRYIVVVEIDRATLEKAVELFRLTSPIEAAICWRGEVLPFLDDGEEWLRVHVTDLYIAVSDSADEYHVYFPRGIPAGCVGQDYIGVSHSHTQVGPSCTHSHNDAAVLFLARRALFSIVFCANGESELLYQDGRRIAHRYMR